LVVRVRLGDEGAFQSLFETYYTTLCDFVHSYLHSPESAEELVQIVFLRIWEHRPSWEPTTSVRAYLFEACRNQALGVLKHERIVVRTAQRALSEELALGSGGAAPLPDEELQAAKLAAVLQAAV
jgi:RNA polymerase sigma-70 factor (ECF subfamily)